MRLLHTNLERSKRAQDLLFQMIRESRVALTVVVEPYRILDTPNWVSDLDVLVAMTWTSAPGTLTVGNLLEQGKEYALYVSPNSDLVAFEEFLDRVGDCVRRYLSRQVLVLGDFNVHCSLQMGYPQCFRWVSGWRVTEGVASLSDHLYIFMEVGAKTMPARENHGIGRTERSRPPSRRAALAGRLKDRDKSD